jgi:1-deoxy-D-xylulose-5-phosphate reductoisomerase
MAGVTLAQAVSHPNWSMGTKISIDSATMMNKGLELIEAYHLFPVSASQIKILVHPESIIHSMVAYKDGSVLAQMGTPDMRVPIAYALGWPKRMVTNTSRLDLTAIGRLTFKDVDEVKFPALRIAREALVAGGAAPAIMNAANEIAVDAFTRKQIGFLDIVSVVENTLQRMNNHAITCLEDVVAMDSEARSIAQEIIATPVPVLQMA